MKNEHKNVKLTTHQTDALTEFTIELVAFARTHNDRINDFNPFKYRRVKLTDRQFFSFTSVSRLSLFSSLLNEIVLLLM